MQRIEFTPRVISVDGDTFIEEFKVTGVTTDGRRLQSRWAEMLTYRDGLVMSLRLYFDPIAFAPALGIAGRLVGPAAAKLARRGLEPFEPIDQLDSYCSARDTSTFRSGSGPAIRDSWARSAEAASGRPRRGRYDDCSRGSSSRGPRPGPSTAMKTTTTTNPTASQRVERFSASSRAGRADRGPTPRLTSTAHTIRWTYANTDASR
jgi:hypothetical protein